MLSTHRIARGTAVVLALGAIGVPAASARPARMAPLTVGSPFHSAVHAAPAAPQTSPNGGFDWADAGIGAAGGLVLSLLGVGGALAISERRTSRTGASAAATG